MKAREAPGRNSAPTRGGAGRSAAISPQTTLANPPDAV